MDAYQIFSWFLRYDVILKIAFAVVTMLVCLFSYKIYKLTGKRELKLFSLSFLVFSISYIITFLLNLSILFRFNKGVGKLLEFQGMHGFKILGFYSQGLLFLIGLVLLVYMALKLKDKKVLALLLGLVLIPILTVPRPLMLFHIMSSLLLAYIVIYYYKNYVTKKRTHALMVLLAFIFLFSGHLLFILSPHYAIFHLLGDILELAAYVLILVNLIFIGRK